MKNSRKVKIFSVILAIFASFIAIFIFWNPFLRISVRSAKITVDVFEKFDLEKQASARIFAHNLDDKIRVVTDVDFAKVGEYSATFHVKFLLSEKTVSQKISVVDREKPRISLRKGKTTFAIGEKFSDPGVEISDNYDKNLTAKIRGEVNTKEAGKYEIFYEAKDSSGNVAETSRKFTVKEKPRLPAQIATRTSAPSGRKTFYGSAGYNQGKIMGPKYFQGILVVNKKYALPENYNPGDNPEARGALTKMQNAAARAGFSLPLNSAFRSFSYQKNLYNSYAAIDGVAAADTYSARPGHSEHQTGLAFDIGNISDSFGDAGAGKWIAENMADYGFILRYPKGKEYITGYKYEPWHVRYVGVQHAQKIFASGLTLEEYLGID